MTKTRVDYELPYKGVNTRGLRVALAGQIDGIGPSDISLLYGRGHPDAISDQHVVGLIFDIDPSSVSQTNVNGVTTDIESILGTPVYERGWGSHDPDYLDDWYRESIAQATCVRDPVFRLGREFAICF